MRELLVSRSSQPINWCMKFLAMMFCRHKTWKSQSKQLRGMGFLWTIMRIWGWPPNGSPRKEGLGKGLQLHHCPLIIRFPGVGGGIRGFLKFSWNYFFLGVSLDFWLPLFIVLNLAVTLNQPQFQPQKFMCPLKDKSFQNMLLDFVVDH